MIDFKIGQRAQCHFLSFSTSLMNHRLRERSLDLDFCFRELRYNRNDAATLMNLCLALIVAIILFVTGINRIDNLLLCKAFAVLLHYFLLCCLLWVGCGGACMTILVRKGLDKEEYNPVLKYYLIAWGEFAYVC